MVKTNRVTKPKKDGEKALIRKGLFYFAFSLIAVMMLTIFVNTSRISREPKAQTNNLFKNSNYDRQMKCVNKYGFKSSDYYIAENLNSCGQYMSLGSIYDGKVSWIKCCVTGYNYKVYNDRLCSGFDVYDSSTGKLIGKKDMKCKIKCTESSINTDTDSNNAYINNNYIKGTKNLILSVCSTSELKWGKWSPKAATCCSKY